MSNRRRKGGGAKDTRLSGLSTWKGLQGGDGSLILQRGKEVKKKIYRGRNEKGLVVGE